MRKRVVSFLIGPLASKKINRALQSTMLERHNSQITYDAIYGDRSRGGEHRYPACSKAGE